MSFFKADRSFNIISFDLRLRCQSNDIFLEFCDLLQHIPSHHPTLTLFHFHHSLFSFQPVIASSSLLPILILLLLQPFPNFCSPLSPQSIYNPTSICSHTISDSRVSLSASPFQYLFPLLHFLLSSPLISFFSLQLAW